MDVTDDTSLEGVIDAVGGQQIDLLIITAGSQEYDKLETVTKDGIRRQIEANAIGPLFTVKALQKQLKKGSKAVATFNSGLEMSFLLSIIIVLPVEVSHTSSLLSERFWVGCFCAVICVGYVWNFQFRRLNKFFKEGFDAQVVLISSRNASITDHDFTGGELVSCPWKLKTIHTLWSKLPSALFQLHYTLQWRVASAALVLLFSFGKADMTAPVSQSCKWHLVIATLDLTKHPTEDQLNTTAPVSKPNFIAQIESRLGDTFLSCSSFSILFL